MAKSKPTIPQKPRPELSLVPSFSGVLRHTFATVANGSRDQVAVDYVMGHTPAANDMSAVYREALDDERLPAVTAHVHNWLFETGGQEAGS